MNKNLLIGLGALTLVVGAGMYFVLSGPKDSSGVLSKTLNKDYKGGVKCVQHVVMAGLGDMDNTIYIDSQGKRLRFESKTTYKDHPPRETYMIDDGVKTYMWGSGMRFPGTHGPSGMIIDNKAQDSPKDNMPIDVAALKEADYKMPGVECAPWTVDDKMFETPKGMTFKTMQEMLGASMPGAMAPIVNGGPSAKIGNQSGRASGKIPNMDCEALCSSIPDSGARKECAKSCAESK